MRGRGLSLSVLWLKILLIALYLLCVGAVIATVCYFDHKPVVSHVPEKQPSSILAVIASISNLTIGALLALGTANAWWRSAVRGSTVRRLHLIWEHGAGRGIFDAFRAGWDSRFVAMVAILVSTVHLVAEPLIQRSVNTMNGQITRPFTMHLNLPQTLPDGWVGELGPLNDGDLDNHLIGSPKGVSALRAWFTNETISSTSGLRDDEDRTGYICPVNSTCNATIAGPGIGYHCSKSSTPFNLTAPENVGRVVFLSELDISNVTSETNQTLLTYTSLYLSDVSESCTGTLYVENCTIWSATVAYPVILTSDVITFSLAEADLPPIVSNYTSPGDMLFLGDTPTTGANADVGMLLGIYIFLHEMMTTYAVLSGPHSVLPSTWVSGLFLHSDATGSICGTRLYYSEPVPGMRSTIKSFLAHLAFNGGNSSFRQTVAAQQVTNTVLYTRDNGFLAAAVIVMILGLVAAMTLFWGFWDTGHYQSLSPIETGRAFGAPLLKHSAIGPGDSVEKLLERIGDVPVVLDENGRLVRIGGILLSELAVQSPLLPQAGSRTGMLSEQSSWKPGLTEDVAIMEMERGAS
jgi:Protein of unknown function (DUF3176)